MSILVISSNLRDGRLEYELVKPPLCLAEELLQVRSTCVLCFTTRAAVTHCNTAILAWLMLSNKCRHREDWEHQQGHIHYASLQLHPQFQPWTPRFPSDKTISILLWSYLFFQHNYLALHIARCRQVYLWALHTFSCSPYLLSSPSCLEPLLITTNNYSIVTVCTLYNQFIIDLCLCYYGN